VNGIDYLGAFDLVFKDTEGNVFSKPERTLVRKRQGEVTKKLQRVVKEVNTIIYEIQNDSKDKFQKEKLELLNKFQIILKNTLAGLKSTKQMTITKKDLGPGSFGRAHFTKSRTARLTGGEETPDWHITLNTNKKADFFSPSSKNDSQQTFFHETSHNFKTYDFGEPKAIPYNTIQFFDDIILKKNIRGTIDGIFQRANLIPKLPFEDYKKVRRDFENKNKIKRSTEEELKRLWKNLGK